MTADQYRPESQQLIGSKPPLSARIASDFRSGKQYLAAKSQSKALARSKQAAEARLASSFQQMGNQAADLGIGADLAHFREVQIQRQKMADVGATVTEKASATQRSEDALAAEAKKHSDVLAPLEIELKALTDAVLAARRVLDGVQREAFSLDAQISKVKSDIARPSQGLPTASSPEDLQRNLAELEQAKKVVESRLAEAKNQHDLAQRAMNTKAVELNAAKQRWNEAKAKCEADLASARAGEAEAGRATAAAQAALIDALRAFGKAVYEANTNVAQLESSRAQAQAVSVEIADFDAKIKLAEAEAEASKGGATRAAMYVGGALVTVVGLVAILWACFGGISGHRLIGTWQNTRDRCLTLRFTKAGVYSFNKAHMEGFPDSWERKTVDETGSYTIDKGTLTLVQGDMKAKATIQFVSDDELAVLSVTRCGKEPEPIKFYDGPPLEASAGTPKLKGTWQRVDGTGAAMLKKGTAVLPQDGGQRESPVGGKGSEGSRHDTDDFDKQYEALVKRVRVGMTSSEVIAILGQPAEIKPTVPPAYQTPETSTCQTMTWHSRTDPRNHFIVLSFKEDMLNMGGTPGYDVRTGFKMGK